MILLLLAGVTYVCNCSCGCSNNANGPNAVCTPCMNGYHVWNR